MSNLIKKFLLYLEKEKGASPNTVAAYKNDLQQFLAFLQGRPFQGGLVWASVTPETLTEFVERRRTEGAMDSTVARKVAAIKSFFSFLNAEGVLLKNQMEGVESPHVGKTLPKPLSDLEVNKLLEQSAKLSTPDALRDRAMLEVLYATGMRSTELVSLNVGSVQLGRNSASVRCKGKKGEKRTLPLQDEAAQALEAYLEGGRDRLVRRRPVTALFVNRRGDRLTRQGLWLILKGYAKQAGITKPVTPQTLRNSFAAHMLRLGTEVRIVQGLLGHANTSTTMAYTHVAAG